MIQLQGIFKLNLIDGRVLASLQRKDLEKYLGISKRNLQTSLLLAIEFLKKHEFDIQVSFVIIIPSFVFSKLIYVFIF